MKTMKINKKYLKTLYYDLGNNYTLMMQYSKNNNDLIENIYIFNEFNGIISHCFGSCQKIRDDITIQQQIKIMNAGISKNIEDWQNYIDSYREEFEDEA